MKCHFANHTEPLKEGVDLTAACGEVVPLAQFAMFADQELVSVEQLRNAIGLCRQCRHEDLPARLVYVIFTGEKDYLESL